MHATSLTAQRTRRTLRAIGGVLVLAASATAACTGGEKSAPPAAATKAAPGPRLYVSDETGGNVVIVDPVAGAVIERIPVGKRPRGLKLSKDGTKLYVALSGSPIAPPGVDESKLPPADRKADGIGVVDLTTRKLEKMLPSGQDPEAFDLSPDGGTIFLSNEETAEMTALDLATGSIRSKVKVGEEPEGVTVKPGGEVVYVTSEGDNAVFAVDPVKMQVIGKMAMSARPRSIVFTKDGATAFVTNENLPVITVVDGVKHAVITTIKLPSPEAPKPAPGEKAGPPPVMPRPMGTALSTDGTQVFVSLGRYKGVAVIDVASRKLVKMIEDVGARPWGIAVSADGLKLFTANGSSQDVSIVDIATGKVDLRITVGGSPWGVVVGVGR